MTIVEALSSVMRDVQAVRKTEKNTAPNGGFMFRGIDAVTNAVGPALRAHGVIVMPEVVDSVHETVTVGKNHTPMSSARLTVRFTWIGPEGDSVSCTTVGSAFDSGDKAASKAHSVAFRIAMIQTLCLPTDEPDPDLDVYERAPLIDVQTLAVKASECGSVEALQAVYVELVEPFKGAGNIKDAYAVIADRKQQLEATDE